MGGRLPRRGRGRAAGLWGGRLSQERASADAAGTALPPGIVPMGSSTACQEDACTDGPSSAGSYAQVGGHCPPIPGAGACTASAF